MIAMFLPGHLIYFVGFILSYVLEFSREIEPIRGWQVQSSG